MTSAATSAATAAGGAAAAEAGQKAAEAQQKVAQAAQAAQMAAGAAQAAQQLASNPAAGVAGLAGSATGALQMAGVASPLLSVAQSAVGAMSSASSLASAFAGLGGGGSDQSSWLGGGGDRRHVTFGFHTNAKGGAGWQVRTFAYEERLDVPYTCVLELSHDDALTEPLALLGQSVRVDVTRTQVRSIYGVVQKVERGASGSTSKDAHGHAKVTIVPALWALSRTKQTRIFQEVTVPQILKKVIEAGLKPFDRKLELALTADYKPREHCTQMEESDLDFVTRLLQEEGIWYRFEQKDEKGETLCLHDGQADYEKFVTSDGLAVPFSPVQQGSGPRESVFSLVSARQLVANAFVATAYNWTKALEMHAEAKLDGELASVKDAAPFEEHLHAVVNFSDVEKGIFKGNDLEQQVGLHKARRSNEVEVAFATSELTGIGVGMTFELTMHPVAELNRKWLVVAARHEGTNAGQAGETRGPEGKGPAVEYLNHLELIPAELEYRPKRTLFKKRVFGVMTATVTGPKGQEIYTDKQGRIKVQFHWDREGKLDEKTSCFVRSMQPWAGTGWGVSFLPRIGMEVVVNFIDGDIDKPLVVGTVYNGTHAPPYVPEGDDAGALTKSTIKSQSTPGGTSANFNEIRFEDQIGKEEIFIQAEKDMNEKIKKSHSRSVGAGESISVGGDRSLSVGKDESITVKGNQTTTVTQMHKTTVTGDTKLEAKANYDAKVTGTTTIDSDKDFTMKTTSATIVIKSGDSHSITIDTSHIELKSGGSSVVINDKGISLTAANGASVTLVAGAQMMSSAGSEVLLGGNARMTSSTGSELGLSGNATLTGKEEASVSAPKATLAGASGNVVGSSEGVSVGGAKVKISGQGMTSIGGAPVKIN